MEQEPKESDQLPEEAPAEQVADDSGEKTRSEAERDDGVPPEGQATGHPDNAG